MIELDKKAKHMVELWKEQWKAKFGSLPSPAETDFFFKEFVNEYMAMFNKEFVRRYVKKHNPKWDNVLAVRDYVTATVIVPQLVENIRPILEAEGPDYHVNIISSYGTFLSEESKTHIRKVAEEVYFENNPESKEIKDETEKPSEDL